MRGILAIWSEKKNKKKHTNDLVQASNKKAKIGLAFCVGTSSIVSKVEAFWEKMAA